MKQQYQGSASEAVKQFREWATENEQEPIQLSFPTQEMVKLAEQSLGELLRHAGKMFIEGVLVAEAEQIYCSTTYGARQCGTWSGPGYRARLLCQSPDT